jgi:hypothetical protein
MVGSERAYHRQGALYYLGVRGRDLEQPHLVGDEGKELTAVPDVD